MEALRIERMGGSGKIDRSGNDVLFGIELGKKQLKAVMNTINSNIEMGTVINAGPFLYMLLKGIEIFTRNEALKVRSYLIII